MRTPRKDFPIRARAAGLSEPRERWRRELPYSLIMTLRTREVDVDLYTPIQNRIAIPIPIPAG